MGLGGGRSRRERHVDRSGELEGRAADPPRVDARAGDRRDRGRLPPPRLTGDTAQEHASQSFGEAFGAPGVEIREAIEAGGLVCGTPEDALEHIEGVLERSCGLGGILCLAHEWADTQATFRSYELLARYVMPHFQGQMPRVIESRDWFEASFEHAFGRGGAATRRAYEDAGQEPPAELARRWERAAESADAGGEDRP